MKNHNYVQCLKFCCPIRLLPVCSCCLLCVCSALYFGEFETTFISNVSYLSLGAVVQKIVKPMGQVFTLQDVEAVSSITFILTTTLDKLLCNFLWCFRGYFNQVPHLQALITSPHLREKAEKLNNAHACLFYFFSKSTFKWLKYFFIN